MPDRLRRNKGGIGFTGTCRRRALMALHPSRNLGCKLGMETRDAFVAFVSFKGQVVWSLRDGVLNLRPVESMNDGGTFNCLPVINSGSTHASCLMPHASCLVPHASCLVPHSSRTHQQGGIDSDRFGGCSASSVIPVRFSSTPRQRVPKYR